MLAAGNARRRPAGESDLAQPGSVEDMPAPPGRPIEDSKTTLDRLSGKAAGSEFASQFAVALSEEAARLGIDPLDLARLYAKAYARPQPGAHRPARGPSLIARLFPRKARP
jgi:hypothetical protein